MLPTVTLPIWVVSCGSCVDFNGVRGDFTGLRAEANDFRRATVGSFNALRADTNDLRADTNDRFNRVDNGFAEMRAKLDVAAAGQQQIVGLIQGLIDNRGGDPR